MIAGLATAMTLFVAVSHFAFMILESVLWTKPQGRKIFGNSVEKAEQTRVLAANQGIYNGCLGATIIWSVAAGDTAATLALLAFVIVVGIYGAATAARAILFVQATPALIAAILVVMSS
jgi:putative membrane protein